MEGVISDGGEHGAEKRRSYGFHLMEFPTWMRREYSTSGQDGCVKVIFRRDRLSTFDRSPGTYHHLRSNNCGL